MNTLIITAHPSSEGFTHKVAQRYAEAAEGCDKSVHIIDLYDPAMQQGFLTFESVRDIKVDAVGRKMRDAITQADEMILIFPMWWFGMPAVMKNFFDNNFGAGFAFRFTEDGKLEGLLRGKIARVITTADGPGMMYAAMKPFFALPISKGILGFCGIKTRSVDIYADRAKWRGGAKEADILAKIEKYATIKN